VIDSVAVGIDFSYQLRRFFKRLLHNFWDADSLLAAIGVWIAEKLSKTALHAAGMLSARRVIAGFAVLTGIDGFV